MGKVALWGAAGAVGATVAEAFRKRGRPYRVIGRSRAALDRAFAGDPLAEIVTWDPSDPGSVGAAAADVETIVYLVGVDYTRFDLHPIVMRATLEGAVTAGVARLLLVGTVYPYGRPRTRPVREDHPREPHTFKGRMRLEQEELLLSADRAGRIAGAVLRVPDFYGPGVEKSVIAELFRAGVEGKRANLLAPLDAPHEYAYVPDIGPVVVRMVDEPRVYGRVWHVGSAGPTTQREMLRRVERELGHPVPAFAANKTVLRLLGIGNPLMREFVEMHYLMTDPIFLDDSALQAVLGPIAKTPYDAGVRATLAALRTPAT